MLHRGNVGKPQNLAKLAAARNADMLPNPRNRTFWCGSRTLGRSGTQARPPHTRGVGGVGLDSPCKNIIDTLG